MMTIHKAFCWCEIYLTSALTQRLNSRRKPALRERRGILHRTPIFIHRDKHSSLGICTGQTRSIPQNILSFPERRMGRRGAVEKRVISTAAAGEQKATWFWGEEERRRGDVGPEGISERPTLRGWAARLCCSAEIEQTCLLRADADYKTLFKKGCEDWFLTCPQTVGMQSKGFTVKQRRFP